MIKRSLYFIYERLQITAAERNMVYGLTLLLLLITAARPLAQSGIPFDEEYYKPLMQEFEMRSQDLAFERKQLMTRYYPDEYSVESTKPDEVAFENNNGDSQPITPAKAYESASPDEPVNINTAGIDELTRLPGIGPAIAARIVEYREANGPFETIEEIKNVRGIGEARFEAIREMITVKSD